MSEGSNKPTLVDQWVDSAKNHRLFAILIFTALVLGGVVSASNSVKEILGWFASAEKLSIVLVDPSPAKPRKATVVIKNEGTTEAVVENLVMKISINSSEGLKEGIAVFFPSGTGGAIAAGQTATMDFEAASIGMFPTTEATNPAFVDFFRRLGTAGVDVGKHLGMQQIMNHGKCAMSVTIRFSSGHKSDSFPELACSQAWDVIMPELYPG